MGENSGNSLHLPELEPAARKDTYLNKHRGVIT